MIKKRSFFKAIHILSIPSLLLGIAHVHTAQGVDKSKLYSRIGLGYSFTKTLENKWDATLIEFRDKIFSSDFKEVKSQPKGINGEIGLGYQVNDNVRSDILVSFLDTDNKHTADSSQSSKSNYFSRRSFSYMVNGYYDFHNVLSIQKVVPFITIGAGFEHSKYTAHLDDSVLGKYVYNVPQNDGLGYYTPSNFDSSDVSQNKISSFFAKKSSFTYQAGFGASYQVSDKIFVDFTYRLTSVPKFTFDTKYDKIRYNRTSKEGVTPVTGNYIKLPREASVHSIAVSKTEFSNAWNNSISIGMRMLF